jgi:hypothetical protein
MNGLWWPSVRPEFANLSDRARLAILLNEAATKFEARGLDALSGMCRAAARELRQADREDQRLRSALGVGEGGR